MCILPYLQNEVTLRLTYVTGKYRVAPIRHMTILKPELQAALYGVCLRKQILSKYDVRNDKIYHWTTHQHCYSSYKQRTRKNNCSLRTEQRNYRKTHRWLNGDTSKVSKTLPTSEPEDCPSKALKNP